MMAVCGECYRISLSLRPSIALLALCCSVVFGQSFNNVAVLVSSPIASEDRRETIKVYKDVNQTVTIDKATFSDEGPGLDDDRYYFDHETVVLPTNSDFTTGDNMTTLTLPISHTSSDVSGIYTVSISDTSGSVEEIRVLIQYDNAVFITTSSYYTVEDGRVSSKLFEISPSPGTEIDDLRWRLNGRFYGRTFPSTEDFEGPAYLFEAFVQGDYADFTHPFMNVIVRDCNFTDWGDDCTKKCPLCYNGGVCSDKTGLCQCPPGFSGKHCHEVHGRNVFGQNGEYRCNDQGDDHDNSCRGKQICYPNPFGCVCPAGYMGLDCNDVCRSDKFGSNCNQSCHCGPDVSCRKDTGICSDNQCAEGWKGTNCQVRDPCPDGVYGDLCTLPCVCTSGDDCSEIEANCLGRCAEPWTGPACNQDPSIELDYIRVNPGASTTITCTAIRNPLVAQGGLRLWVNSNWVSSTPTSESDSVGYNRTNIWTYTLNGESTARCVVSGTSLSRSISLTPYELPSFNSSGVLEFSNITSTSINVSWPAWQKGMDPGDGPISGYILYHSEDGSTFTPSGHISVTETSYQYDNLVPSVVYSFSISVVRVGDNGSGPRSNEQSQRTLCGVPAATTFTGTPFTYPRSVYVYYAIPGETDWNCQEITVTLQKRKPGGRWEDVGELLPGSNYRRIESLIPCTLYHFQIQTSTSGGSMYRQLENIATEPEDLPAVDNLLALPGSESGSLMVSWDPLDRSENNCSLSHYVVKAGFLQYEPSCTGSDGASKSDTTTGDNLTLVGLAPSANYRITVYAQGDTKGSETSVTETTNITSPSAPPGNVQSSYLTSRYILFQWNKVPCVHRNGDIQSYHYKLTSSSEDIGETRNRYKPFDNLIPYTNYSFQVAARTSAGLGPYSDVIWRRTDEDSPPAMMAPVSPFANLSAIQIRWEPPSPPHGKITQYRIQYRREGASVQPIDMTGSAVHERESLITGLRPNSNYSIRIRAYTSRGHGGYSPYLYRVTEEGIPGPPANLQVVNRTQNYLTLYWNIPEKPQGSIIEYQISYRVIFRPYSPSSREQPMEVTLPDANSQNITRKLTGLEPSTTYEISVSAATGAGTGEPATINRTTELFTDFKRLDVSNIKPKRKGSQAEIELPALTEKYATGYRLRVRILSSRQRRDVPGVQSYEDNPEDYIAAELPKSDEARDFTIGDNMTHGGFWNAPLQVGVSYDLSIQAISKINGEFTHTESDPITIDASVPGEKGAGGGDSNEGTGSSAWYVGLIVLFLLGIIAFAGFILYKRRENERQNAALSTNYTDSRKGITDGTNGTELDVIAPSASLDNIANSKAKNPEHPPIKKKSLKKLQKAIKTADLAMYVKNKRMSTKDTLADEYEMLPEGQLYPWTVAAKPQNKVKNRYGNIIPYDDSRVVLATINGDPHSDYFNASYIDGYRAPNKYIACHGANKASVTDFWRMIWQEECSKIVMLTNLLEGGKRKCEKYWPDEVMKYSNIIVTLKDTLVYSTCTLSTFTLSHADTDKKRDVRHYHFTAWPDMKVPEFAGPILDFIRIVREEESYSTGPLVVHCSAGVGRTGTYITLDAMLDMAAAEGKVNVFQFVCELRQRRIKMVQVVEQYQFIFDALVEHFVIGNTAISVEDFRIEVARLNSTKHSAGDSLMLHQFKMLDLVTITPPAQKYVGANKPENKSKNRFPDILPVDTFRAYLMTDVGDKGTNYINATFLGGYQKKNMFLGTQMPLESTMLDFWRMVWDYNSPFIVMLNELNVQIMSRYWPDSGRVTFGPFTITLLSLDQQQSLAFRQLEISNSSQTYEKPRTITHVQCLDWPQDRHAPSSPKTLLQAVNMMNQSVGTADSGPITVHCIDGVGRTGVFCALAAALSQLKVEKKADVFQLVNKLRNCQPYMLTDFEHYKLIFDCINSHLEDDNIYENFSH